MSDGLHNDPFESLFRDKLNEESTGHSWDKPGDDVWAKIEEGVAELPVSNARSKVMVWPWLVALVLIIILLLRTCNTKENPAQLLPIAGQEKSVDPTLILTEVEGKEESRKIEKENTLEKEITFAAEKNRGEAKEKEISSIKTKGVKIKSSDIEESISNSKGTLAFNIEKNISQKTKSDEPTLNQHQKGEERRTLSLLKFIPSLAPIALETNHPNIALAVPPEIKTSTPLNPAGGARRFFAGIYYAPAISYRNIIEPNRLRRRILDEQEKPGKVLLSGGLRLGYRLASRWTLETGLQLTKTEVESLHRARLAYDRNQEIQNASGGYDSNYRMTLSTSFGEVATDVALTRNAATTIPANLPTFVLFELKQNFTQLRIPLTVRYELGGQQLRCFIRSGFAANLILDQQIQISRIGLNRAGLRPRQTRIVKKFEGLNDKTLDYLIAFGLSYQASPSISLMLEPSFLQSLTPAFEKGTSKTYPNLLSLNIGVNYHF